MEQENRLTTELSASSPRSERHVGFELLRIVSMAMIVMMHMIGHGGLRSSVADGSTFYYILAAVCARQGIDKLLCYADGVLYGHFEH